MRAASYFGGRRALLALAIWVACAACGYFLWRSAWETYLPGQALPRVVPWIEPVTVVGAASCGALLCARMPHVDGLSVRPLRTYSALMAAVTVLAFGLIPLIPLLGVRLAPDRFPPGTWVDTSEEVVPLIEVYTMPLASTLAISCAFYAAVALLCVISVGKVLGGIVALALYVGFVVVQSSTTLAGVVPLLGAGTDPLAFQPWGLAWLAVAAFATVLAWRRWQGIPYPTWR